MSTIVLLSNAVALRDLRAVCGCCLQIVELENEMNLSDGTKRGRDSTVIEPRPSHAASSGSRSSCCS